MSLVVVLRNVSPLAALLVERFYPEPLRPQGRSGKVMALLVLLKFFFFFFFFSGVLKQVQAMFKHMVFLDISGNSFVFFSRYSLKTSECLGPRSV